MKQINLSLNNLVESMEKSFSSRNASEEGKTYSLGKNTKSSVDFKNKTITFESGEVRNIKQSQDGSWELIANEEDNKFLKYLRLSTARNLLFSKEKAKAYKEGKELSVKTMKKNEKKSKEIGEDVYSYKYDRTNAQHRTTLCHFALSNLSITKDEQGNHKAGTTNDKQVSIYKNTENENFYMKGQFICSSVWTCPVCSAKIAEGRKNEISKAFDTHRANGGYKYEEVLSKKGNKKRETLEPSTNGIYLFTLTLPHYRKDILKDLMQQIRLAVKYFKEHRQYKKALKELGYIGEIRALEVTWSNNNGWHPHFHSILFFENLLSQTKLWSLKRTLLPIWKASCLKAGLKEPNDRGIDIKDGSQAKDYINKWGVEHEVAKWTSKKANKETNSYTPFQLLDLYRDTSDLSTKILAKKLFNEYAEAFRGFRQLYWSPKLKARFGVNEVEDEELAQEADNEPLFLGSINEEEWSLLQKQEYKVDTYNISVPFTFAITRFVKQHGFPALKAHISNLQLNDSKFLVKHFGLDIEEYEKDNPFDVDNFYNDIIDKNKGFSNEKDFKANS